MTMRNTRDYFWMGEKRAQLLPRALGKGFRPQLPALNVFLQLRQDPQVGLHGLEITRLGVGDVMA